MLSILKQFLVEQETPQCKSGFTWCPVRKKCIPAEEQKSKGQGRGEGFGKGKGPIGVPVGSDKKRPRNERRELVKEPPVEVDKDIELKTFENAKEALDLILGEIYKIDEDENALNNAPEEEPEKEFDALKKDIAESLKFIEESEYQKYFETMMKKFGVTKPSELKGDKKKEFFNAVDKGWKTEKSVNEVDQILDEHPYGDFFLGMLKKFNVKGIMQLDVEKRKEFFNAIKSGWAAKKKEAA
jgi:hypothetical protein